MQSVAERVVAGDVNVLWKFVGADGQDMSHQVVEHWQSLFRELPLIQGDAIAQYYFRDSGRSPLGKSWSLRWDFPDLTPRERSFFVEFSPGKFCTGAAQRAGLLVSGISTRKNPEIQRVVQEQMPRLARLQSQLDAEYERGLLRGRGAPDTRWVTPEHVRTFVWLHLREQERLSQGDDRLLWLALNTEQVRWLLEVMLFADFGEGMVAAPVATWELFVRSTGALLLNGVKFGQVTESYAPKLDGKADELYLYPALLALSCLNTGTGRLEEQRGSKLHWSRFELVRGKRPLTVPKSERRRLERLEQEHQRTAAAGPPEPEDVPFEDLMASAARAAGAAKRLPREQRFSAFVRGLPDEVLKAACYSVGKGASRKDESHPYDPLFFYITIAARSLLYGSSDPDTGGREASVEMTEDELVASTGQVGLCLMLDTFRRGGLVESIELPMDPFDGKGGFRIGKPLVSEADLRQLLGETAYEQLKRQDQAEG